MSYKTILVHGQAAATAGPRLECAVAIAREFDALLVGVGAGMIRNLGISDPYGFAGREWIDALQAQVDQDLKAAEAAFFKVAGARRQEWRRVQDFPTAALARNARAADLIVASAEPGQALDPYRCVDIGELVLSAGRPVLIVPPGSARLLGRSVIVAWKDTREARRAVADALPFLQKAETVIVIEICAEDEAGSAEIRTSDVAQALGRHGVKATARVVVGADDQVADLLDIEAGAHASDLIVAGGYGRSRLAEWVFGGVTRRLLKDTGRFLLMSH